MPDKETIDALGEINTQIALLNQSIRDQIIPLIYKHEHCLYGKDGTDGLSVEVVKNKAQVYEIIRIIKSHIKSHLWWASTIIIVACTLAGILARVLK